MTEVEWLAATDPLDLMPLLRSPWADWKSKGSNRRRLQLFACATCRRFWPLLGELGLQATLAATERYADREASAYTEAEFNETQNLVRATWELVRQVPKSAPGYGVSHAVAWATCWWGNRYFAENAVRELLELTDRWAAIKSLIGKLGFGTRKAERLCHVRLLYEIFGNPFRTVTFSPAWGTDTATALARKMYESHDFSPMPILADALQDAGCDNADILNHCRSDVPHVRGCWVVDAVLGKS